MDLMDNSRTPDMQSIMSIMDEKGARLWQEMCSFMTDSFKASSKFFYSTCSGKPGWNVKFMKSGKSYCTLYPEAWGFTALVVFPAALVPLVQSNQEAFTQEVLRQIGSIKPLNGGVWLMLGVASPEMLNDVKRLLQIKFAKQAKA